MRSAVAASSRYSIEELPEARESLDINDFNLYGYKPLVQALADRYELTPEQVVTTQGTSMANYLAIAAVVKAGRRGAGGGPGVRAAAGHPGDAGLQD